MPPYAAVQVVEGVRHTRGTPPAVVEMDAETWIALATGALDLADAEPTPPGSAPAASAPTSRRTSRSGELSERVVRDDPVVDDAVIHNSDRHGLSLPAASPRLRIG